MEDITDPKQIRIEALERDLHISRLETSLMMALAQVSTEPGGVGHFVRRALEVTVRANDWIMGQYWVTSKDSDVLHCSDWYFSTAHLREFRAASMDRSFSKGVGLPGRIWSNQLPVLVTDIASETGLNFTRKTVATKSGLLSAFGFPVRNGPFLLGVCEFFDSKPILAQMTNNLFYEKLGIYMATLISQKEAEYEARRISEVNKIILDHAYNAFISINEVSVITQWTKRASDTFGWMPDEVIGRTLQEVIIPERYRDAHIKGLFRYMSTKTNAVLNKRVRAPALHKDGHEFEVELLIFPIEALNFRHFGAFIVNCSMAVEGPAIILE